MTLTTENREAFIIAHGLMNYLPDRRPALIAKGRAALLDNADLKLGDAVETRECFADFVRAHGQPTRTLSFEGHEIHCWDRVQMAFGKARGMLYLMEFEGVAASFFTGQSR